MCVVKVVNRKPDLLEVIGTLHPPGGFPSGLNGRKQESDQNADDRNDYQKFNKSEANLPTQIAPPPLN